MWYHIPERMKGDTVNDILTHTQALRMDDAIFLHEVVALRDTRLTENA